MKPMMFKYPVVVGDAPVAIGKMTIEPAKRLEIWIGKSRDTREELNWALRRHPKDVRIRIPRKSAFATSTALFAIQHEDLVREQIAKGAIVVATPYSGALPLCTLALSDLAPVCALDLYPSDAYGLLARHAPLQHEVVRVVRNPVTAELYTTAECFPPAPRTVKAEPILVPLRVWSTAGVGAFCERLPPLTLTEEDTVARNWSKYSQSAAFLHEGRRPVAYLDTTTVPYAIERACALAEHGVLCVRGDLPLNLRQLTLIERHTRNTFLFFDNAFGATLPEQTKKVLRLRRWRAS